ncbi:MAG: endolytic transglycosylase MltG [Luminiphilus sp.]|nr:endolytic transglycosylase MltG [Luminiphilus sp.]
MKPWLIGLILVLSALVMCLSLGKQALHAPMNLPQVDATIIVEQGDSLKQILAKLKSRNFIESSRLLEVWARWQGIDRQIHTGEYQLIPGLSGFEFLERLKQGDVVSYQVTLPEGITLQEALQRLHDDRRLVRELQDSNDPLLLDLVLPLTSPEGWFLPETYRFVAGDSDLDILRRAHRLMQRALMQVWANRSPDTPLTAPYEALILASIVERETSVSQERATIAGVFTRRLEADMRLQTDPTVIYGLGSDFNGNLTRQHLRDVANPWNTYRIKGLPPTPIALPGVAALEAAVRPASGAALYFVARGDGYHVFSETLEEHNANVQRYQLSRKADYRSTPNGGD